MNCNANLRRHIWVVYVISFVKSKHTQFFSQNFFWWRRKKRLKMSVNYLRFSCNLTVTLKNYHSNCTRSTPTLYSVFSYCKRNPDSSSRMECICICRAKKITPPANPIKLWSGLVLWFSASSAAAVMYVYVTECDSNLFLYVVVLCA